jgi:hypothetical protein
MQINTLRCMGLRVWPPKLVISSQSMSDIAVLMDVRVIIATDLLRVDVEHNMIPDFGIILVEKGDRESLYHKLKENIGRSLADIGELEMDFKHDQEEEGPIRAIMG